MDQAAAAGDPGDFTDGLRLGHTHRDKDHHLILQFRHVAVTEEIFPDDRNVAQQRDLFHPLVVGGLGQAADGGRVAVLEVELGLDLANATASGTYLLLPVLEAEESDLLISSPTK